MTGLSPICLTPAQAQAAGSITKGIANTEVAILRGDVGHGKTTILAHIHKQLGGVLLGAREFMTALRATHPYAIEEAFLSMIEAHLAQHDVVLIDDLHLIWAVVGSCDYPRGQLLNLAMTALVTNLRTAGKKLIVSADEDAPSALDHCCVEARISGFGEKDYRHICAAYLGPAAETLDYDHVYRFASHLDGYDLKNAAKALRDVEPFNTDVFIEYLTAQNLISNVEVEEVEKVDWNDLKGVDELIEELEAKIALPFENQALAAELQLKPKRGVLLSGPPGTGKTTIGRALAHRLKGKFFLIDGTAIARTDRFYAKVESVFTAAKRNAPAVVFIDDADVIFAKDGDAGLYRYLLTMLDGLESESAKRVCVMLTAMEPGDLPPALLRSGRLEMWLETRLPEEDARQTILRERFADLPAAFRAVDIALLAALSKGLTGADLKAVVEDGKLLFAYDRTKHRPVRPLDDYFLTAIEAVRAKRRNYVRRRPAPMMETVRLGFTVE